MAVEERRRVDAASGHEIATLLEGKINRKVCSTEMFLCLFACVFFFVFICV